jgi:D-amino-acid oxidase
MSNRDMQLPKPDFDWDPRARPPIAGLRPFRDHSNRLEPEIVEGKFVVHNYGHGGAGMTLSRGCCPRGRGFGDCKGFYAE